MDYKNFKLPAKYFGTAKEADLLKRRSSRNESAARTHCGEFGEDFKNYIFYKDSTLLTQLRYYPYVQLTVIACFSLMAYFAFSYSRKAEQNRVWVGLAKETAHQLGTPLSSLNGLVRIFKSQPQV